MESSYFSRRGLSFVTIVAMLASQFSPLGLNMTYAAAGTFVAAETVANVTAGANTQTNADATPTPNITLGADTQTNADATPTPNVIAVQAFGSSAGSDGSTVTAVTFGTSKNGLTVTITDLDGTDCASATLGGVTPAYTVTCDLDNTTGTGTVLTATALTALIDGAADLTAVIKGTAGNTVLADTITLAGGVDAVAQVSTITPGTVEIGDTFTTTINGTVINYVAAAATVADVTAGLTAAINGSAQAANVTAVDNTTDVQVTSDAAGTPFTIVSAATNRAAVAQVSIVTPGTVEIGDTFTTTINGTVINYVAAAATVADVTAGLTAAINGSAQAANVTAVDNTTDVQVTSDAAGTPFTIVSAATNRAAVAQQVTFTANAPSFADQDTFRININGTNYDYTVASGNTESDVINALSVAADAHANAVCTDDNVSVVTCTATPAGTAFTSYSSTVLDITPPTIVIGATPTSVNSGSTVALTFTLSEPSVNFTSGDVTVAGGTLSAFAGAGTGYTATFTPTPSSTTNGTIDVAGSTFTDIAGNNNTAATQNVITVDTLAPTVILSTAAPDPTNSSSFTVTATFSEAVTGMLNADFVVVNGTKSAYTAVSPTVYTVLVTPVADGAVTIDMAGGAAIDAASNASAAATQLSRTYDSTNPSVVLSTGAPNPTNGAFTVTATFSEAVTGMALGDFVLSSNAGKTAFNAVSSTVYTILVTPTADGLVTIDLPVAAAQDLATNNNGAATQLTRTYDFTVPTIVIGTSTGQVNSGATVGLTFTLSESSVNFTSGDVTVVGGSLSAFAGAGTGYTATFTPTASTTATATIDVAGGVFTDAATNNNTAATQATISVDTVAPTIVIGATPTSVNSGATSAITFTLSEASTNFTSGDVTVAGGTLSAFAGAGTSYTATFTPTASSTANGTIDVAAGAFTDAAGNNNIVAIQNVISVDTIVPTVVLTTSAPNPTNNTFTVTATFSEAVTGVAIGDFVVSNGTPSAFSGVSSTVYTILVTPTSDGAVTIDIAAAAAQDSFLNDSTAASQIFRVYDATAPVLTVVGSTTPTIAHGSTYVESGATWADALDGTGTVSVASSGSVNTSTVGVYVLSYWKVDAAGNTGSTVTRTVTVADQTIPVVTLSGSATNTLVFASTYTELGASWTDNVDGAGNTLTGTYGNTGVFQSSGTVNTSIAGTYSITYRKVDAAGNIGSATRTITVSPYAGNGGGSSGGGSSGGGSSNSSVITAPIVTVAQSGSTDPIFTPTISTSSNPHISQDIFTKKSSDYRKSNVIQTKSTLPKGTYINIIQILPNGKTKKVGTTRVLRNGNIRFELRTAGKYKFVQR